MLNNRKENLNMITDKEIMQWSSDTFGPEVDPQWLKLEEEMEELKKELADVWIVMCGLKARGVKKLPSYKTFCKNNGIEEEVLRDVIEAKMQVNLARKWKTDSRGVFSHPRTVSVIGKLKEYLINIFR